MTPDFQFLMRHVLECAARGEVRISDVVETLTDRLSLSQEDREQLLPSGKQTRFANRVHWAKSYLKQAGLVKATKRAHFIITERGRTALAETGAEINRAYLERFFEFREFQVRTRNAGGDADEPVTPDTESVATPDEVLRQAHQTINAALAMELLDRVRNASPAFFESLIVDLLLAMGYGGTSGEAGRAIGKSGDDGVDGVIDQDPLGVDQIYIQAKRYAAGNSIDAGGHSRLLRRAEFKKGIEGNFRDYLDFQPLGYANSKRINAHCAD